MISDDMQFAILCRFFFLKEFFCYVCQKLLYLYLNRKAYITKLALDYG